MAIGDHTENAWTSLAFCWRKNGRFGVDEISNYQHSL